MRPIRTLAQTTILIATALALSACAELQELRSVNQQQRERIRELQDKVEASNRDQLETMRQARSDVETLRSQLEATREELRKAQTLRSEREEKLLSEKRALEAQLRDVSQRGEEARKDTEILQTELDKREKRIDELQKQVAELETKLNQTQGQLETRSGEASELERRTKALTEERDKLKSELETARSALEARKSELTQMREDLKMARARVDELEANTKRLKAQTTELQKSLEATDQQSSEAVANLRKEAAQLQQQIQKIEAGEIVIDADFQKAHDLLRASLKPVSEGDFATVELGRRGVTVRMTADYLFQEGLIDLDPAVLPTLDQIGEILSGFPKKYIVVEGHTDSQPIVNLPFTDNWALASARADKVVRYLVNQTPLKNAPERVKSASCAQYRPVVEKRTPEAARLNRRVEIVLTNMP